MNLNLKVIPHKEQRYCTCGDWWLDDEGVWQIRVSSMADWRYEFLVGLHEIVELGLCTHAGVSQHQVDRFDMEFEKNRAAGNEDEPGDDPKAPYAVQHCIATGIERVAAAFMGVSWREYEEKINSL